MNNTVATKTIAAFSINFGDWYYEGQLVDIVDSNAGILRGALIKSINDENNTFIVSAGGREYNLKMAKIKEISLINRRKLAV